MLYTIHFEKISNDLTHFWCEDNNVHAKTNWPESKGSVHKAIKTSERIAHGGLAELSHAY